jgi:hypothetical protein
MTGPDGFNYDMQTEVNAYSEQMPRKMMRRIRSVARIDQSLAFTKLEFATSCLGITDEPKLFFNEQTGESERRTLLAVPLGHVGIHPNTVFVAINIETPHPNYDGTKLLRATAYKFDTQARQICQYPEQSAILQKDATHWQYGEDFGPFINVRDSLVDVICWDSLRLRLQTENFDKLSPEAVRQRSMAQRLASELDSFATADQKTFSLLPAKL